MLKKIGEMTASFYGSKAVEVKPKPLPTPARKDPLIKDFDISKDFELKTALGTGTFGRVRLVKSLRHGKYFALKILKKVRKPPTLIQERMHLKRGCSVSGRRL